MPGCTEKCTVHADIGHADLRKAHLDHRLHYQSVAALNTQQLASATQIRRRHAYTLLPLLKALKAQTWPDSNDVQTAGTTAAWQSWKWRMQKCTRDDPARTGPRAALSAASQGHAVQSMSEIRLTYLIVTGSNMLYFSPRGVPTLHINYSSVLEPDRSHRITAVVAPYISTIFARHTGTLL